MSATEGINETNKLFMDAFSAGDAEKVAGFYTANCRFYLTTAIPLMAELMYKDFYNQ